MTWRAHLALEFERSSETSILARQAHQGPLRVLRALYPETPGICHAIVVHPPGGIAGGDELKLDVRVANDAHALVTTPGATRWYRSSGALASQSTHVAVAPGAVLEWLPQETIVFDEARAESGVVVDVETGGTLLGWEVLVLGRAACGERFAAGSFRQRLDVRLGDRLVLADRLRIDGGDQLLGSTVGLDGATVIGTLVLAGPTVGSELVAACRASAATGLGQDEWIGVSAPAGVLVARFVGHHAERARACFERIWHTARPAYCRQPATPPRIWAT